MNKSKRDMIVGLIESTKGKFFSVNFTKADNSLRDMNCRIGVKKHLKGGVKTYDAKDKETGDKTIGVFDQVSGGYRSFKASRVNSLVVGGVEYTFNDRV
jgi:transcription initiation factor TFIID subunit TAF12